MGILVRFFMKIAVTYDEDSEQIFQHFGHTEALKIYNIEDNKVISTKILSTEGHGHSVIADLVRFLLCKNTELFCVQEFQAVQMKRWIIF